MKRAQGKRHNADHAAMRAWLKAHGRRPSDVDALVTAAAAATRDGLVEALCRLHGCRPADLAAAGG